jgi:polyisoprenyl-phosphate glycosyltransferase
MKISVLVPVFNEGELVFNAYDEILKVMTTHLAEYDYEIIFIDDGSIDDTFLHLNDLGNKDKKVKVIKFITNRGSHMAVRAGFDFTTGDYICFLPCDLQEPPSLIPLMVEKLKAPYDIVWAVRNSRKDKWSNKVLAKIFYWMARKIVSKNIPPTGASSFMLTKKAIKLITLYKEKNLTLEGLFATMGFKSDCFFYEREKRKYGKSKWTTLKKIKLLIDFFVAYSYTPIRFISFMGIILSTISFIYGSFIIINKLFLSSPSIGWTEIMVAVLFIGGIQIFMIGIIGEYIWRMLDEVRKRPNYIIDKLINI